MEKKKVAAAEGGGRRAAIGAWGLWGMSVALLAAGALFLFLSRDEVVIIEWGFRGFPLFIALPFATVGAVLAFRRPANPIGWILAASGLITSLQLLVEEFSVYAYSRPALQGPRDLAAWVAQWIWMPASALVTSAILLFPNGRPLTARWKIAVWILVLGTSVGVLGAIVGPREGTGLAGDNPFEVPSLAGISALALNLGLVLMFLGLGLAAASIIVRMKRSKGDERQQLKWLVFGAALYPVVNIIALLPAPAIVQKLAVMALVGFPLAVGVAVLKYRLYEIDVVINRALVYAALTVILALTYLGIVVVLQRVLSGLTEDSDIAVAGSTLAVAALFGPLRTRLQALIDRRFYRRKYDAASTLEAFSTRLRDQVDLEALTGELTGVVGTTMQPQHCSVWLRTGPER